MWGGHLITVIYYIFNGAHICAPFTLNLHSPADVTDAFLNPVPSLLIKSSPFALLFVLTTPTSFD